MIKLSRITDYGIVLMAFLAEQPPESGHSAREIAEHTQLPLPVVSKILKALTRQGLLHSQRGPRGGYRLARQPDRINVVDMVTALEGPIGLTECTLHPGQCQQEASCHVRKPWQQINQVVRSALARVTLAQLASPGARQEPRHV
jgi:FeS assembly SUF system regulator